MKVNCFGDPSRRLPLLGVLSLAAALAGCSGSTGGINAATVAHVRDYNAIPDSVTAVVSVNGNALPGSVTSINGTVTNGQGFLQAASYTSLAAIAATFSFTLTSNMGTTFPVASQSLAAGDYYTAFLFGRAGITSTSDARYPKLLIATDDRTTPPVGDARLRVVQASPDSGNVDVLINGQVVASNIAYESIGSYLNVAGGNLTVQVNQAGTSTVLVPAETVTVTAGLLYTLLTVEPYLTPSPAYSIQLQSDAD